MLTSNGLLKTLSALTDARARELRLARTLEEISADESVRLLDEIISLCGGGTTGTGPDVAMLAFASWLFREGESARVIELRTAAALHDARRLLQVLQREPEHEPDHGAEAEAHDQSEIRVPDYGMGREITLGERKTLARQPRPELIKKLARDPHPHVVRELLTNPHLTEALVIQIVARRPAIRDSVTEVVRSPKWLARPRVRLTIVLNPGSPVRISAPLLPLCNREELRLIAGSPSLPDAIREAAARTRDDRNGTHP